MMYLVFFMLGLFVGRILHIIIKCLTEQKNFFSCSWRHHRHLRPYFFDLLLSIVAKTPSSESCRYCCSLFSLRKLIEELLTSFLFIQCFAIFGSSVHLFKGLLFTSFLIVISFIDYDTSLIYDKVLLPMAVIGATLNIIIGKIMLIDMFSAAMFGGLIFLMVAIIGKDGFGGGDIKFMACIGLWLGISHTILAIFLSFILGGTVAAFLIAFKIKTISDKFPYGPYIALASFITLLYGDSIISWYWKWAFMVK
ncbi:MAG: A24 family peptidase [Acidaminococcaceae bacterium]